MLDQLRRDARYALQSLRREPTFALTALLTLTLGIATATTVFSVVDAEQWRPLPLPEPSQLISVHPRRPGPRGEREHISAPDYLDWRAQSRLVEYAATAVTGRRVLRRAAAESVSVLPVTANYFQVLRFTPRLGRPFAADQDARARSAILSDKGWRRLFDAQPAIIGQAIALDGADYIVVGVTAGQHLQFGAEPDAWVTFDPAAPGANDRLSRTLDAIGRMRPGVTLSQAGAELAVIASRIAEAFPEDHSGHRVEIDDLRRSYSANNWRPLFFFLGAAILVLVMSCLNVASLLIARALRRQREFAIRGALGGGRGALAAQLVVEGAVLAIPSALAGALLSNWALQVFAAQLPEDYIVRGGHVALDARITMLVVALTAITTVALSLAPILYARRVVPSVSLGNGARTAGRTPGQARGRTALLVAQLTLTLVLMTAAGLLLASFVKLTRVPLGFDPRDRVALRVSLSGAAYAGDEPVRAYAFRLLERAGAIPGVAGAAVDSSSPLGSGVLVRLVAADRPQPKAGEEERAIIRSVSPGYFSVFGIAPRAGRVFSNTDVPGAPRAAIINEYLAGRLFPGENAVGQRIDLRPARASWANRPGIITVVGVVPNVKDVGINEVEFGNLYLPFAQAPVPSLELIVRSVTGVAPMVQPLRAAVAAVDPALPVTRIETLDDRVDEALQVDRFNFLLIGVFAVVAMLLAAVGIYGAMACAVQERTREFGVRLALGQAPAALVRATLTESARLGLLGASIGLIIVGIAARLIGDALYLVRGVHNGVLYGVTTTNPIVLISAMAGLIVVAVLSGLVPARQASRVDPAIALRSE